MESTSITLNSLHGVYRGQPNGQRQRSARAKTQSLSQSFSTPIRECGRTEPRSFFFTTPNLCSAPRFEKCTSPQATGYDILARSMQEGHAAHMPSPQEPVSSLMKRGRRGATGTCQSPGTSVPLSGRDAQEESLGIRRAVPHTRQVNAFQKPSLM